MNECKWETWQKFVSKADERSIWKVNKYLNSTPINTFIPTLEGEVATNEQKANTLKKFFFPPPPPADLSDIPDANYPDPMSMNPNITICKDVSLIPKAVINEFQSSDQEPPIQRSNNSYI